MRRKLVDRLLGKVGLVRLSQTPIRSMSVAWPQKGPPEIDIELRWGQRIAGVVVVPEQG